MTVNTPKFPVYSPGDILNYRRRTSIDYNQISEAFYWSSNTKIFVVFSHFLSPGFLGKNLSSFKWLSPSKYCHCEAKPKQTQLSRFNLDRNKIHKKRFLCADILKYISQIRFRFYFWIRFHS